MLQLFTILSVLIGATVHFIMKLRGTDKDIRKAVLGCTVIICLLAFVISVWSEDKFEYDNSERYILSESNDLYAIKDSSSTSGTFFVLYGNVNSEDYYKVYIETEDGLSLKKYKADTCYLRFIDDYETPHIDKEIYQKREIKTITSKSKWILLSAFFGKYHEGDVVSDSGWQETWRYRTIIYVPEGSVTQDFELDME